MYSLGGRTQPVTPRDGWLITQKNLWCYLDYFWCSAGQLIYKCPDLGAQSCILNAREHRGNFGGFVIKSAFAFVGRIFQSLKEKGGRNIQYVRQFEQATC